jgi:tetratricopeptide (TPR) repeat protein
MGRLLTVTFAVLVAVAPAWAQAPQAARPAENLQYFPKDIPRAQLIQRMREFSFALDVRCQHCHSGGDGVSFEGVNFASDDKPAKVKARAMLRMVDQINNTMVAGKYNFGEWEINEAARQLTEAGKTAEAIAILEMNGEFYPKSADIDFTLGELHRARKENDQAIARYRAALEKNPQHQGAKRWLTELTKQ